MHKNKRDFLSKTERTEQENQGKNKNFSLNDKLLRYKIHLAGFIIKILLRNGANLNVYINDKKPAGLFLCRNAWDAKISEP